LKIQKQFQKSYNRSANRLIRVIKREGLASAFRKSVSLIFSR
jgi:hypothetical protein